MRRIHHFNPIQLGDTFRKKRKERKLRLEDLADQNISVSTISNIERGLPNVHIDKLKYLAKKLGLELHDLVKEKNETTKKIQLELLSIENTIKLVDPDEGLKELKKLEEKPMQAFEPMICFLKGKCYYQKHQWEKAEKYFFEAIRSIGIYPHLEHTNIKAACYNELSSISYYQNQLDKALQYVQEGINSFIPNQGRSYIHCILLANKAIYLERLNRLEEALQAIDELWKKAQSTDHIDGMLSSYHLQAIILRKTKMYSKAIECAKKGIEKARINEMVDRSFELWIVLGSIYFCIKQWEEAKRCFLTALKLKNKITKKHLLISAYTWLGLLHIEQNQWQLSESYLEKAIQLGEKHDHLTQMDAFITLGDCYRQQKAFSQAIQAYEKAHQLLKQHDGPYRKEQEYQIVFKSALCWRHLDEQRFQECKDYLFEMEIQNYQDMEVRCHETYGVCDV